MPRFATPEDVRQYRRAIGTRYSRIPQYRSVVDRKMPQLEALVKILAPDYQKVYAPYQSGEPAKAMFRLTNIMASNQSEIRFKARSTDPDTISLVQEHEDGHEALDPILFPIEVRRKMYSFLCDSYTIVALDVKEREDDTLAGYADREELESYAEGKTEPDETDDSPQAKYKRAYDKTNVERTTTERHQDAYDKVTTEAMLADGAGVRVRVVDAVTFKGFQVDGQPEKFAIGMEFGRKELNPMLSALGDFGVRVENNCLYIQKEGGEKVSSASYEALGVGMIADAQNYSGIKGEDWVEYTQIRTLEETVILIEAPKGGRGGVKSVTDDPKGAILIKIPNPFKNKLTGYFLIEGDGKLRSGDLEDRYDPPLLNLINDTQYFNITMSGWSAMALAEMTRPPYQYEENPAIAAIEPVDAAQESKVATPQDGQPVPVSSGRVLRIEGYGQNLEHLLAMTREMVHDAAPNEIWAGSGSSSETGIAIARRQTALLTELTPYQATVATVCKLIHQAVDAYCVASGETIQIAYLAPGTPSGTKPEVRKITPESAKLPMDMDYTLGSDTPESLYAAEQMAAARYSIGAIGMTELREEMKIKDPQQTEMAIAEDRLVTMVTGTAQTAGVLDELFISTMKAYAKAALERELGPTPPPPPQLVGPDGVTPIGGAAPPPAGAPMGDMGAAPMPVGHPNTGPAYVAPSTQTIPNTGPGPVPVTPGGVGATV